MKKIFDYDFRNELFLCLRESGIKDKEIREIIRKRYKESLKDEVVERLNTVIKAIKEDNLEEIIPFIGDSPSGDDYGCDNRYISFKDVTDCEDIGDVIDALMENERNPDRKDLPLLRQAYRIRRQFRYIRTLLRHDLPLP